MIITASVFAGLDVAASTNESRCLQPHLPNLPVVSRLQWRYCPNRKPTCLVIGWWLSLPLRKNIWVRQLGWQYIFRIYGKVKNMFQTHQAVMLLLVFKPLDIYRIPSPIAQVRLEGWILCIKLILQFLTIYKNKTLQQASTRIYIKTKPKTELWDALDPSGVYDQNPNTNFQVYNPENF